MRLACKKFHLVTVIGFTSRPALCNILNLRGKPQKDYTVSVKGGVGNAEIKLPKDIGVFATATGGLGGVDTTGMTKDGNQYVNEAYKKSPVTIRLTIEGGVGAIKLMSE